MAVCSLEIIKSLRKKKFLYYFFSLILIVVIVHQYSLSFQAWEYFLPDNTLDYFVESARNFSFCNIDHAKSKLQVPWISKQSSISYTISIGFYYGNSPLSVAADKSNDFAVLRAEDIPNALFVADPFIVLEKNILFLFFEVLSKDSLNGDIAVAIFQRTKRNKFKFSKYIGRVLDLPFHLSYPYIFQHQSEYFMIPESHANRTISLFRAKSFPCDWIQHSVLLYGNFCDSSVYYCFWCLIPYWYMWTNPCGSKDASTMLFYSLKLTGPWSEHSNYTSTKSNNHGPKRFKGAGRIVYDPTKKILYRFVQDYSGIGYGPAVRVYLINSIYSHNNIFETEIFDFDKAFLHSEGGSWKSLGMHHIDVVQDENQWIAAVDGWEMNAVST